MRNEIVFLLSLTVILVLLLAVLLAYLIIRKVAIARKERQIASIMKANRGRMMTYLQTGAWDERLIPVTNLEKTALEQLLMDLLDVFKGEEIRRRAEEYTVARFAPYYQKQLFHRDGSIRVNTLYRILDFQIFNLNDEILQLLQREPEDRETFLGCKILARSQDERVIELILDHLPSLTVYELRVVVQELDDRYFQQLVSVYKEHQEKIRFALLETIGLDKRIEYLPLLEQAAKEQEGEERIRALKAISFLGYIRDTSILHEAANSARWEERLMTAKIIGRLCTDREAPLLYRLIEDRVWRVRHEAGRSLSKYKQANLLLQEVAVQTNDPYAKDMALEWLERIH
jgi:hypothetical protein